jgi:protein Mpv17
MLHVLVGTVVGAVVGGVAAAATSAIRGKKVTWKSVAAGAAGGAAFGAIATATLGVGVVAGSTALKATTLAVAGATAGATDQVTHNVLHDETWHDDVGKSAAIGGALGAAGGLLAKPLGSLGRSLSPSLSRAGNALSHAGRRAGGVLAKTPGALRGAGRTGWQATRGALRKGGQFFKGLWKRYLHALDTRPIITKGATAGTLGGIGDIAAQKIQGAESIDWKRTAFMAGWGALLGAPAGHWWFLKLNTWIPGRTFLPIVGKLALDRMVWMPINASLMIGSKALYDGKSFSEAVANVRRDLIPAWKAGVLFWSSVHGVNFRFVPQNLQIPFGNAMGLIWGTIFSAMINDTEEEAGAGAQGDAVTVDGRAGAESPSGLPLDLSGSDKPMLLPRGQALEIAPVGDEEPVFIQAPAKGQGLTESLQAIQR